MKKQDIINAIDIQIRYCIEKFFINGEEYKFGYIDGLRKAKEVIERLDRGEMQFADKELKDACDRNCHCHVGIGCRYFTRHCLCCRKK